MSARETNNPVDPSILDSTKSYAGSPDDTGDEPSPLLSAELPAGAMLGRYSLVRELGRGAYGIVYLAHDTLLNRSVALKMYGPGRRQNAPPAELVISEARTAAQFKHPAIVSIHDVAQDKGVVFIVMEYVEGGSLSDLVRAGKLDARHAARLMITIAEAVDFAHRHGLVHRDLKPGNILLDQAGAPRVSDFGLAVHESNQREFRGNITGTPAYMAPEQIRGEVHRLDGRADVWSLGVILYVLLSGRLPFNGRNRDDLFDEIQHREAKPLRQTDPAIPRRLEQVCLKCLCKEIDQRYATAGDLATDLRRWLEESTARRGRKYRIAAIGFLSIVLIALGLGYGFDVFRPSRSRTDVLVLDRHTPVDQPFDLLDHGTRVLVPSFDAEARVHPDGSAHTLRLQSKGVGLFALGEIDAPRYQVELTLKPVSANHSGVFFGFKSDNDENPREATYFRVEFRQSHTEHVGDVCYAYIFRRNVVRLAAGDFGDRRDTGLGSAPMPPITGEVRIKMTIVENRIETFRCNDVDLPLSTTPLFTGDEPGQDLRGFAGVYSNSNAIEVTSARVRVLP